MIMRATDIQREIEGEADVFLIMCDMVDQMIADSLGGIICSQCGQTVNDWVCPNCGKEVD